MELSAWPEGPIDAIIFSAAEKEELPALLEELRLDISSLGYYRSHLDPDGGERARVAGCSQALLRLAADLGMPVASTHAAGSVLSTSEEQVAEFVEVFSPHLELAGQLGMRVARENCLHGPGGGNSANGPGS